MRRRRGAQSLFIASELDFEPRETEVTMKVYGHPWSINTRKTLMTLAEKGHEAELVLVMIPKGEHKGPEHMKRHPFGKVPALEDDGFFLYETRAINAYLDRQLQGPALSPKASREAALVDQWTNAADAYFVPHAAPLIVESLFRQYLGGDPDTRAIAAGRVGVLPALDTVDRWLSDHPFFAGNTFTSADIHWMPYFEYLIAIGEGAPLTTRKHLSSWWDRVSARPTWLRVARTGPQPYEKGMTADVIEKQFRR